MCDFTAMARRARIYYEDFEGFLDVSVEGNPPIGLRYSFASADAAESFESRKSLQQSNDSAKNTLCVNGNDVVEIWSNSTGNG